MKLLAVNFHYFREQSYASGIYPVNRKALEKQLAELEKHYSFASQGDIAQYVATGTFPDKNLCVITIDDGLKEQMEAFSFLKEKGVPAILYVPTAPIQNHTVLDVHKLHHVRTVLSDTELYGLLDEKYSISSVAMDENAIRNQYRYDDALGGKVKYFLNFILTEKEKEEATDYFFSRVVADEKAFSQQLYMNESDLKTLANEGVLGSHGMQHIPLATVPFDKAKQDIKESITYLENLTGKKILSFSYPYGGKSAVNATLQPAFDGTSVTFAFTMWRGINNNENLTDPFFLLRVDTNDAPGGKNNSSEFVPASA